jgi:signal transduction histidine kinase
MLKTDAKLPEDQHFIVSTLPPRAAQKRLASAVVLGILVVFALISFGPLKGIHLRRVDAFVPAYAAAMFVCDSITAILLYAQFSILRSRAILIIASGYLFTALTLIAWFLTFPGVFVPGNLLGGLQSTNWLYFVWHGGFALFVIAYALSKKTGPEKAFWRGTARAALGRSAGATAAAAFAAGAFCIAGEPQLPAIMLDATTFGPRWPWTTGAPLGLLCACAIIALWVRRHSVLDLWLMVVMCLYLIEIPLSYYPDPVRFSLGWYTVRAIGFLASSLVLVVLLYEIQTLYTRLPNAALAQRREREARLMTGDAVAASIAHELRQPLTAMVTTADAGFRFLDRASPNFDRAKEAFKQITADGHRAGEVVESLRGNFKNNIQDRTAVDLNELIEEALALGRSELQKHGIRIHAEPNRRLPEVRANRVQLQQVLLNLIMNAVDAMAAKDEPRILSVKSEPYQDDRVIVSIADTGTGIAPDDVERIFNPLFTTKTGGMGMGLSICRAIIEAHEGRLWFAPNRPHGAVFQFTVRSDELAPAVIRSSASSGALIAADAGTASAESPAFPPSAPARQAIPPPSSS